MAQPATTRLEIEDAIKEHGPMTIAEIHGHLPHLHHKAVAASVQYGHKRNGAGKRFFYIRGHKRSLITGGRLAPVYDLGDEPDSKPPKRLSSLSRTQAYQKRHATIIALRKARKKGKPVDPWLLTLTGM